MVPPPAEGPLRAQALLRGLIGYLESIDERRRMVFLGRIVDRVCGGILPIPSSCRVLQLARNPYDGAFETVMDGALRVLVQGGEEMRAARGGLQVARAPEAALRYESALTAAQRYFLRLVHLTEKDWNSLDCDPTDPEVIVQAAAQGLTEEVGDPWVVARGLTTDLGLLYPANDTGETALVPVFPEV
jgi:hypothetical protein